MVWIFNHIYEEKFKTEVTVDVFASYSVSRVVMFLLNLLQVGGEDPDGVFRIYCCYGRKHVLSLVLSFSVISFLLLRVGIELIKGSNTKNTNNQLDHWKIISFYTKQHKYSNLVQIYSFWDGFEFFMFGSCIFIFIHIKFEITILFLSNSLIKFCFKLC